MLRNYTYNSHSAVTETASGKLRGFILDGVYTFHGIQYASASRWHPARPVSPWEGIKDATTYGYCCPIPTAKSPSDGQYTPHRYWLENEDCLNLNIWTKSLSPNAKKPVIVWLHGGAYTDGSSIEQVAYEGDVLADYGDVVVVTLNHRLNILGFLDLSSYGEEYKNSGNIGIADIVEALRWIRNNIKNFGGDPGNITVFGQSGGAGKACSLLQIPEAAGLFHKVILMSGGYVNFKGPTPPDHRLFIEGMLKNLGLHPGDVKALEIIPYPALIGAYNHVVSEMHKRIYWKPIPNDWYPGHPLDAGFTEFAKNIPIIVGSTFSEMNADKDPFPVDSNPNAQEIAAHLHKTYGAGAQEAVELFTKAYPDKSLRRLSQTDVKFRSGAITFMDFCAQHSNVPCYNYVFSLEFDVNDGRPAWHCSDIPFLFHNSHRVGCCNIPRVTEQLEDEMAGSLISFAYSGDPNHPGMHKWDCYSDNKATMVFDRCSESRPAYDRKLIETLLKYGPALSIHD